MDQQDLRELEYRCIQEEPPWCTAACPIHVDARAFVGYIGKERWADAWKVLQKHMPLPGILGRICDAPCEPRCKRREVGEAIRIGALERTCVQTEPPVFRVQCMPANGKRIAAIGSGLSSLTAAWHLARKGYVVTVFEAQKQLGAGLRLYSQHQLPSAVIDQEIDKLTKLGVKFQVDNDSDSEEVVSRFLDEFEAVYLGLDAIEGRNLDLERDDQGAIRVAVKTQTTNRDGLFAGGQSVSPVWQTAHGHWAAISIDRYLQGVSLSAGREKEGPYETRLFTSLKNVSPLRAVSLPAGKAAYSPAEAQEEARRCLQCECMECVKVCAYLETFGAYPKKFAREIYNNLSIVIGNHPANNLINSCSLCGLCEQVCPNDFAMQDLCLEARQTMVKNGKMPPAAHEFALLDMAFSQSDRFALTRHQPGYQASKYAFFPGCQLCASAPGQVEEVYAYLRSTLSGGVGLMLGCCGAPAHWAGNKEQFELLAAAFKAQWESLARPRMILACSTCLRMFKENLPLIPAVSLWSVLDDCGLAVEAPSNIVRTLAVHDPCTTRNEAELQACVRRLLNKSGVSIQEIPLGQDETECCGFGGLMQNANPNLAREVAKRRAERDPADYVAYCAMCRDSLAAIGKRVIHLLDLFFPDSQHADPALRPRPGWSDRQENRARLKAKLLKQLWNENPDSMEAYQKIKLDISQEIAELMDQRRILVEDLQQVIQHAETTGEGFFHPPSGSYKASYAPFKVTFWVEYSVSGESYLIHNAYSHRMEVLGP